MRTVADDLVTWLRAQLDAIEGETRTLLYWTQQTILTLQDPKLLGKHIPGWHDWPKVERMCRVRLAELDAKRRILDLHADPHECPEWDRPLGETCTGYYGAEGCPTLRLLALEDADRPGYREEWRP